MSLRAVLLILAAVAFLASGLEISAPKVNLIGIGLLLFDLAFLFGGS